MQVPRVTDDPAQPSAPVWRAVPSETVSLTPVPVDKQPNDYIRAAWRTRPYGRVSEVGVAAAEHGGRLFIRLEWADSAEPNAEFLDGAGVFFPGTSSDDGPETIGTRAAPVRLWAWRDRLPTQQALPAATDPLGGGADGAHSGDADRVHRL